METQKLNDENLLLQLNHLVRQERELLVDILHCLREVERRRLFSAHGYGSLFTFAVGQLGYSEDQAFRRIQAMKLLRDLPEIESKIGSGALTLTNLGLVHSHLKQEERIHGPMERMAKLEILNLVSGKPTKDADKLLRAISSLDFHPKPDRDRAISGDFRELRISISNETSEKLKELQNILAHAHPFLTLGELLALLCDLGLQRWGHTTAAPRATPRRSRLHQEIWARDGGKCTNCQSTYALQVDHVIPKAKGGTDEPGNLRLLCRSCNQRAAIVEFGLSQMEAFLN